MNKYLSILIGVVIILFLGLGYVGITISDSNDCMVNYSLGQLYVPCVSVPDAFGAITVYDIKLNQQAGSFTFDLDMGSVKPR